MSQNTQSLNPSNSKILSPTEPTVNYDQGALPGNGIAEQFVEIDGNDGTKKKGGYDAIVVAAQLGRFGTVL